MILFIMLHEVVLSSWIKPLCVTIHMKATSQYINSVQLITLYKVGKTLHSLDHNDN